MVEESLRKTEEGGTYIPLGSLFWGPGVTTFVKIFLRVLNTSVPSDTFAQKMQGTVN